MSSYLVNRVQPRLLAHAPVSLSGKTFSMATYENPTAAFLCPLSPRALAVCDRTVTHRLSLKR